MKVELDRKTLETLVKGSQLNYNVMEHPLLIKAGHRYSDQYGRTYWDNLKQLSNTELWEIYLICRKSWESL